MGVYVDGFVLPVPKNEVAAYRKIALKAGKVWMEHGALAFHENVADDVKPMPLDSKRMFGGGFKELVAL